MTNGVAGLSKQDTVTLVRKMGKRREYVYNFVSAQK